MDTRMTASQRLHAYISQVERRLRLGTLLRGAAILASAALLSTIVLVLAANALAFSSLSVTTARVAPACIVIAAAAFGLAMPLSRVNRRQATREAERIFPTFQQRLETFLDKDNAREPFIELLAADTLEFASDAQPEAIAPKGMLLIASGI